MRLPMPRCCVAIANEFSPCYASVLVAPDLEAEVHALERASLLPSITAWCATCQRPYLLTGALPMFSCPSAHHAHMIAMGRRMRNGMNTPQSQ